MPQNKNTYEASVSKSSANTNTSREDAEKDGGYDKRAEEVAGRTVLKQHKRKDQNKGQ